MGNGEPGINLDRAAITGFGLLKPFEVPEQVAKVRVHSRVVRLELQCTPKRRLCGFQATQAAQCIAEIVMRFGKVRRDLYGALAACQCGSKIAFFTQHAPEIVMRRCEVGVQIDGAAVAGAGLGWTPGGVLCVAEIGVSLGRAGRHGDRFADQLDRALRAPIAQGDYPEQMQRVGIIRRFGEYLVVNCRGAFKPPRTVMLKGCRQLRRNGCLAILAD
jgi:hypothetical protein